MFNKLKQFKDLRDQAKQLQNKLSQIVVDGTAEWNKIKVLMNGNQEVTAIEIDPSLLSPENKTKLEKGIAEATNAAVKKVQKAMAEQMKEMGGLDFGNMFKS